MRALILVASIFLMGYASAYAQGVNPLRDVQSEGQDQINLLRREVELHQKYTSDILTTVYFALGASLTVVLAALGFGWYQNHKVYERDKHDLENAVKDFTKLNLQESQGELEEYLKGRFDTFDSSIADAIKQTRQQIYSLRVATMAEVFNCNHSKKIRTPRTDFIVLISTLTNLVDFVDPAAVQRSISIIIEYLEEQAFIDRPTRLDVLECCKKLDVRYADQSNGIREILTRIAEK
jgi:hypothetical protein